MRTGVACDMPLCLPGPRAARLRDGIELDANTWQSLVTTGKTLGVDVEAL